MRASATDTRGDPVLVGAGDISDCRNDNDEATAKLLDDIEGTVFTAGDNVYRSGTYAEYMDCYDPTWGRHKVRTKPAPGNHGYNTEGASGYFNYFGAAAGDPNKGYYSYDLGEWHIVVLNSMCEEVGGCEEPSPQITWLKQELANNQTACTLAIWHHPLFSSGGEHGSDPKMQAAWDALYAANAELVVNGHDHDYERFAPQTPSAVADPTNGIREFVVGTGGGSLDGLGTKRANSEVFNDDTYGVLKLTLHSGSYDWEFVPEAGKSFSDSGTTGCH
jgi:3',5'-cyclic AMP phosphodiesterase CpdA